MITPTEQIDALFEKWVIKIMDTKNEIWAKMQKTTDDKFYFEGKVEFLNASHEQFHSDLLSVCNTLCKTMMREVVPERNDPEKGNILSWNTCRSEILSAIDQIGEKE